MSVKRRKIFKPGQNMNKFFTPGTVDMVNEVEPTSSTTVLILFFFLLLTKKQKIAK